MKAVIAKLVVSSSSIRLPLWLQGVLWAWCLLLWHCRFLGLVSGCVRMVLVQILREHYIKCMQAAIWINYSPRLYIECRFRNGARSRVVVVVIGRDVGRSVDCGFILKPAAVDPSNAISRVESRGAPPPQHHHRLLVVFNARKQRNGKKSGFKTSKQSEHQNQRQCIKIGIPGVGTGNGGAIDRRIDNCVCKRHFVVVLAHYPTKCWSQSCRLRSSERQCVVK